VHISDYVGDRRFDSRSAIESRQRNGNTVNRMPILSSPSAAELRRHLGMRVQIAVATFHCTRATRLSLFVGPLTATIVVRW